MNTLVVVLAILGYLFVWVAMVRYYVVIETKRSGGKRSSDLPVEVNFLMCMGWFWPVLIPLYLGNLLVSWLVAKPTGSEKKLAAEKKALEELRDTANGMSWTGDDAEIKLTLTELYNSQVPYHSQIHIPMSVMRKDS